MVRRCLKKYQKIIEENHYVYTMRFQIQITLAMKIAVTVLLSIFLVNQAEAQDFKFPQAEISNGLVKAKLYLPDAKFGYYRSTRFDWSGAVYSLKYKGHEFYGKWFNKTDPKVINWVYRGKDIVSGPCSALYGPVDEFQTPLGWNEAKPGGTFIKIGVGVLRRGEGNYDRFAPYDILNTGKWTVKKESNSIEFTQELSDPNSGYAYVYRKVVRLEKGKPELVIEQSLKNTGKKVIRSDEYNHNLVVIDKQPPGPDYNIIVPFRIRIGRSLHKELADVQGNQIVFMKTLSDENEAVVFVQGFSNSVRDNEVIIENKKMRAGMKITCNRPLIREFLWSIRTVLAVEPYISIDIQPGNEFAWKNTIEYYTLPMSK